MIDPLTIAISRQRYAIDLELLHLTQSRLAADLERALTILSGVVATRPAVAPHAPDGGVSLPHWSGSVGQQPAPVPNPGMTEPERGNSFASGIVESRHEAGNVAEPPSPWIPSKEVQQNGSESSASPARNPLPWQPSSEWRDACREEIERRIGL